LRAAAALVMRGKQVFVIHPQRWHNNQARFFVCFRVWAPLLNPFYPVHCRLNRFLQTSCKTAVITLFNTVVYSEPATLTGVFILPRLISGQSPREVGVCLKLCPLFADSYSIANTIGLLRNSGCAAEYDKPAGWSGWIDV